MVDNIEDINIDNIEEKKFENNKSPIEEKNYIHSDNMEHFNNKENQIFESSQVNLEENKIMDDKILLSGSEQVVLENIEGNQDFIQNDQIKKENEIDESEDSKNRGVINLESDKYENGKIIDKIIFNENDLKIQRIEINENIKVDNQNEQDNPDKNEISSSDLNKLNDKIEFNENNEIKNLNIAVITESQINLNNQITNQTETENQEFEEKKNIFSKDKELNEFYRNVEDVTKAMEDFKKQGNVYNLREDECKNKQEYDTKLGEAIKIYNTGIELGNDIYKKIIADKIVNQMTINFTYNLKLLYSNIALALNRLGRYEQSIAYDDYIIRELDSEFKKSYARKILNYVKLNNLEKANIIRKEIGDKFKNEFESNFKEIVGILDRANKAQDDQLKKKMSGYVSKKGEKVKTSLVEQKAEDKLKSKSSKVNKLFSFLFGSILTTCGVFTLYWVFKNKNKFVI